MELEAVIHSIFLNTRIVRVSLYAFLLQKCRAWLTHKTINGEYLWPIFYLLCHRLNTRLVWPQYINKKIGTCCKLPALSAKRLNFLNDRLAWYHLLVTIVFSHHLLESKFNQEMKLLCYTAFLKLIGYTFSFSLFLKLGLYLVNNLLKSSKIVVLDKMFNQI